MSGQLSLVRRKSETIRNVKFRTKPFPPDENYLIPRLSRTHVLKCRHPLVIIFIHDHVPEYHDTVRSGFRKKINISVHWSESCESCNGCRCVICKTCPNEFCKWLDIFDAVKFWVLADLYRFDINVITFDNSLCFGKNSVQNSWFAPYSFT